MKHSKLEDCCLTIEQAKELQALGINMDNCLMEFCSLKDLGDYHLLPKHKYENNFIRWKYIPTLTNTEMLEMLPKEIDGYKLTFVYDYFRNGDDKYYIGYLKTYSAPLKELESTLLRNSLFGIIKWLKTNKLI